MLFADEGIWFSHTATAFLGVIFGGLGSGLPLYFYFRSRMAAAAQVDAETAQKKRLGDAEAEAGARKADAQAHDVENEVRDREIQRLINRYEGQMAKQELRHREQFEEVRAELSALRERNDECERRAGLQAVELAELRERVAHLESRGTR